MVVLAAVVTRLIPEPAATRPTGPSPLLWGRLVYASDLDGRWQRLWVLDLGTGAIAKGPRIPRTASLLALPTSGPTELAFVARTPRDRQGAFVLRGLRVAERPTRVGMGDLVAWDPGAPQFATVRKAADGHACDRATTTWVTGTAADGPQRLLPFALLCRGVTAIQQSGSLIFFQLAPGRIERAPSVGLNQFAHLLTGYRLVSTSPEGAVALDDARAPGSPTAAGTGSIYRVGSGVRRPIPLTLGGRSLFIDRALAWSSRSDLAFTSRVDGAPVLYVARLRSTGIEVTRARDRVTAWVGAAFDGDGRLYFADGEGLFVLDDDGSARRIAVPDTAPPPVGPLVWIGP